MPPPPHPPRRGDNDTGEASLSDVVTLENHTSAVTTTSESDRKHSKKIPLHCLFKLLTNCLSLPVGQLHYFLTVQHFALSVLNSTISKNCSTSCYCLKVNRHITVWLGFFLSVYVLCRIWCSVLQTNELVVLKGKTLNNILRRKNTKHLHWRLEGNKTKTPSFVLLNIGISWSCFPLNSKGFL